MRITELRRGDAGFLATMVAISLPFIWVGVVLTMKRLRSARLSPQLVALFFVPFLNLLFFLALCLVPEREVTEATAAASKKLAVARFFQESALGSAAVSLLVTVPVGFGAALLGTQLLNNYGWGLFVALPFTMGFAAALVYGIRQPRSMSGCVGVGCLAVGFLGAALLALAFEGIVCLMMAAPIALPLAAFGGLCAYHVQRRRWIQYDTPVVLSVLLLFAPGVEWTEHAMDRPSPILVVRTAIDIQAPPDKVWKEGIAFSAIPPPTEGMVSEGIA